MRVVGILILVTCVPESLAEHRRWPKSLLDDLGPRKLLQGLAPSHLRSEARRNVIVLAAVNVIMFGASMGAMNVLMLYSEFVFGWGNMESGTFLSMVNFCRAVSTAAVLPYAVKFSRYFTPRYAPGKEDPEEPTLDTLDVFLLRVSIVSDVIGYIGYALAPTGPLFTTSGAVAALGAIGLATSEASMTKLVGHAQTGELLGALGFLQSLARVVAPSVVNAVYSWTADSAPMLVFWGIAACFGVAGVLTFLARVNVDENCS